MQQLRFLIEKGELPTSQEDAIGCLQEEDGKFISQEGDLWDFKREWPFSYSDGYFGGIARIICAFANSKGGVIVFGVHDEHRTPGHNCVKPNIDRLQQTLKNLLSGDVRLSFRRYNEGNHNAVDVLLICPLPICALPIRFIRPIETYKPGIIWVRDGHEVLAAQPKHIPMLYCRVNDFIDDMQIDSAISGLLPPSPNQIKTFVGRVNTIDEVFTWIKKSDEPRNFLYGKGGSGKTTIAYQIAKILRFFGRSLQLETGETFDNVIFVTAKQTTLDTIKGESQNFIGLDFSDEKELYEAILTLGNWTEKPLSELSLDHLKLELRSFFDLTSNFIVIDDIDTLTTKGKEAGFDYIYRTLSKSRRQSKILYTLRNAPSQSLANAIEVPGLNPAGEYQDFVNVCAREFKVPAPPQDILAGKLVELSERRPLVIEAIIAIRRNTSNYLEAINLFEQGSGEDIRSYVFQREWGALPPNNFARAILAIMATYGEPLTFSDLTSISMYDQGRVNDSLGEIREMFLIVNEIAGETTYELGALTKAFIAVQAKQLERYDAIRERVRQYRKTMFVENPLLTRFKNQIEGMIERARRSDPNLLKEAWNKIINANQVTITEDPRFLGLAGFVAAVQNPSKLEDARRYFQQALSLRHEPEVSYLRSWFFAESSSGYGFDHCMEITKIVSKGKRYTEEEKLEFVSRKAKLLYHRAVYLLNAEADMAVNYLKESLRLNLYLNKKWERNQCQYSRSGEFSTNTAYKLFNFLVKYNSNYDYFVSNIIEICAFKDVVLDPLEDPLIRAFDTIQKRNLPKADAARLSGKLENLRKNIVATEWDDSSSKSRVELSLKKLDSILKSIKARD